MGARRDAGRLQDKRTHRCIYMHLMREEVAWLLVLYVLVLQSASAADRRQSTSAC